MKITNPLSVSDIEKIALLVREEFNIDIDSSFPILFILEKLFEEIKLSIQIVEENDSILTEDEPAKYSSYDNFIYIKESVLVELEQDNFRNNFTLAHEFFHYLQTHILNFEFYDADYGKTYEDPEWQANEFAGQLLVPTKCLEYDMSIEEIAFNYKVSKECAATRKVKYLNRMQRIRNY